MIKKYRLISLLLIILISVFLVSCNKSVPRIGMETTNKFTSSDISKAMDIAEKDFKKNKTKGSKLESELATLFCTKIIRSFFLQVVIFFLPIPPGPTPNLNDN